MEIIGRQIEFGLATEATRGTAESTADRWLRKVTADIVERATHAVDETTRGRLEDGEGRRVVQKYVEGTLEGIVHADALGWFLSNLYGKVTTSTVSGSVKDHEFTLKQGIEHQSLSLFVKDGSVQQNVFANAMIDSFELTSAVDDFVRFSANFVAGAATANSSTPSYGTEYDFISRDIELQAAPTVDDFDTEFSTVVKAKDITLTWNQGLIRDHVVGSYGPEDIYNGHMLIEGTITLNFADANAVKAAYLDDSSIALQLKIEGAADIGSGNHPTITIVLPKVQFMDWNRSDSSNELVVQECSFRAFYDPTEGAQSGVVLRNLTSTYVNVPSN